MKTAIKLLFVALFCQIVISSCDKDNLPAPDAALVGKLEVTLVPVVRSIGYRPTKTKALPLTAMAR
jgi:hypothetical protein